jgi:26S proteasome regulatory subunit (ATPase 3-interacting protein)
MEDKLVKLREGVTLVRPEERQAIEEMYSEKLSQWRKKEVQGCVGCHNRELTPGSKRI